MSGFSEIDGLNELLDLMKQLEKAPQSIATKSARNGANIALRAARALAPIDTGELRKGIKLVPERSQYKGKKAYQITFDRDYSDIFVKKVENPVHLKSDNNRAYYPSSQEFGFTTRNGGYFPGLHFIKNALDNNYQAVQQKIVETAMKEIQKLLDKAR